MSVKWTWGAETKNKGEDGFNNAGILTFNSHAINSFVRELFQNSNDAKAKGKNKVIIKIEYCKIPKKEIPAFDQFLAILKKIEKANSDHVKFFKKAYASLKSDKIPFLIFSDSNTKGLEGSDTEKGSSFVACVLSEGKSNKENKDAGGSFGIGKNATYGLSNLRTVFYSSYNNSKEYIFQGVAKLASFEDKGNTHEGRIYLGNGKDLLSVRNNSAIPELFRRTEPGLSQFVMGVDLDKDWHVEFSKAILRNYWILILEGGLEVELKENGNTVQKISSPNAVSLMEEFFKDEEEDDALNPYGNPYLFYEAYQQGSRVEFEIPIIGRCNFHFIENERGENNIAYLRNGMVIYSHPEKRLVGAKTTGVFRCASSKGNEILRLMEPPKHDSFDPEMLEANHEDYKKNDGDLILRSIKSNIRDVIKSLIEKYKEETETPAFLTELFEDLQKNFITSNKGERKNEKSASETIHRKAIEDKLEVNLYSEIENTYASATRGEVLESGAAVRIGQKMKGKKSNKSKGGDRPGSTKGGKSNKANIKARIFHYAEKEGKNIYKAYISSDENLERIEVSLLQFADSGEEVAFTLHKVTDSNGQEIPFRQESDSDGLANEVKIITSVGREGKYLFLEISDNQRSAFVIKG